MTGRGERIAALDASVSDLISGRQILLFRPPFAVNTARLTGSSRALLEPMSRRSRRMVA